MNESPAGSIHSRGHAFSLNARALALVEQLLSRADELRISAAVSADGARRIDCGAREPGSLEAGRLLAEICLAGLGHVSLVPAATGSASGLAVAVRTDQPVAACMASQYAGWQLAAGKFFAMGSGPMRAAGSREPLFDHIGQREQAEHVVGVLETGSVPPDEICERISLACGVSPSQLSLLYASTHSIAGTVQVVARSVETALHKLHELGFDLTKIRSGFGVAPLPPVAKDFLQGIGRTNDAILYGADVSLWVHEDDALLQEIGPRVPSQSSSDYGAPFAEIFARYDRDFYKIDKHLFSPAVIRLVNLASGRCHSFGQLNPTVLERSFSGLQG